MEEEGADRSMSAQHSHTGFAQSAARAKQSGSRLHEGKAREGDRAGGC